VAGTENEIRCPKCRASIFVGDDQSGQRINCQRCQNTVLVPGAKRPAAADLSVDELIDFDSDDDLLNDPVVQDQPSPGMKEQQGQLQNSVPAPADEPLELTDDLLDQATDDLRLAPEKRLPASELLTSNEAVSDSGSIADESPGSDSDSEDLGDLIDIPVAEPIDAARDPFQVDKDADLVVEGVTLQEGQFGVDCHLCGSLLYARVSQVGTKIKCHDCYSLVEVPAPKETPKPIQEFEKADGDDAEGYRLSDPCELEPIDTTIDISLGKIDYDDDEFFAAKRRLEAQQNPIQTMAPAADQSIDSPITIEPINETEGESDVDSDRGPIVAIQDAMDSITVEDPFHDAAAKVGQDEAVAGQAATGAAGVSDDADDYNLLPVPQDVSSKTSQQSNHGGFRQTTNLSDPVTVEPAADPLLPETIYRTKKGTPETEKPGKVNSGVAGPDSSDAAKNKSSRKKKSKKEELDYASPFGNLGKWFRESAKPIASVPGLIQIALVTLFVGACYLLMAWGANIVGGDTNKLEKFGGFFLVIGGGLPLTAILFFLGAVANGTIRAAIGQQESLEGFPEFSLSDWLSQFLFIGTSFWLAAFPGLIFGGLLMLVTTNAMWLFGLIACSSLVFVPLILSSVVYNESPWAFVCDTVFKSMGPLRNRWIRFFVFALVISLVFVLASLLIPFGGLLCFLAAAIQVTVLLLYWWILGDLVGHVVRWMANQT